MSSEKKPQPIRRFNDSGIGFYETPIGNYALYSDHEATIEALRAERDEARKVGDGLHDEVQFMRKAAKENRERAKTAEARVVQLEAALEQIAETPNTGWMIARALLSDGGE